MARKLTGAETYKLYQLVEDEYTKSNLNDSEFAAFATTALGFKVVDNNVLGARDQLNIKSKRAVERELAQTAREANSPKNQQMAISNAMAIDELKEAVEDIDKRLAALESLVKDFGALTEVVKRLDAKQENMHKALTLKNHFESKAGH